jgi:glucose/arabinose dehydrogenase
MRRFSCLYFAAAMMGCGGCGQLALKSADQAAVRSVPETPLAEVEAPAGFRAVLYAQGFNYPSAMDWDARGRLFVLQSHSVPLPLTGVKVVRLDAPDHLEELALTGPGAPTGNVAVGLTFHDGWFYLSHEEKDGTWGVSRFRPDDGMTEAVLRGLPGNADHWVNHLAFDSAGTLYFGVGSATNSGVVSSHDPVNLKWLKDRPTARDIPCRDLVLTGVRYTEDNELTPEARDRATTGAYQPYGSSDATRVKGEAPCTSAVYKLAKGSTSPELVAWGFRNPVGLAIGADGTVYVAAQGGDIRGSRPVLDDADALYRLTPNGWYGWPDFAGDLTPVTDPQHAVGAEHSAAGKAGPETLLDLAASHLEAPDRRWLVYPTEPHAAICGITVVPKAGPFAIWAGQILVSEMGDFRPTTDAIRPDVRAGFQVEMIDPRTGRARIFLRNRKTGADGSSLPASALDLENGLERPVDVRIGPDGFVYVLDFGVWTPTPDAAKIFPKTGKIFRVEPSATAAR